MNLRREMLAATRRVGIVLGVVAIMAAILLVESKEATARHHHHYHRYQRYYEWMPLFDPSFCGAVVEAFSHYDIKDLDRFVDSIPPQRRIEARKCLGKDNGGR